MVWMNWSGPAPSSVCKDAWCETRWAKALQLLFTGGSSYISYGFQWKPCAKESLHVDLSKGKFKEEFTLFVFFTLFVSLEHYGATNSVSDHAVHVILGSKTRRFCSPHNVQVWPRLFAHGHSLGLRYWQSFFLDVQKGRRNWQLWKPKCCFQSLDVIFEFFDYRKSS